MDKKIIADFENRDIHYRMDIHDKLIMTEDIKIIKKYFNDFALKNTIIAQAIGLNKNTPTDILLKLLKDDRYVKNVLANPNTPMDVLKPYTLLKGEGTFKNKMYVLANPNINDEILDILSEDELGMVFWKARELRRLKTSS